MAYFKRLLPNSLVGRVVALYAASLIVFGGLALGLFYARFFTHDIQLQISDARKLVKLIGPDVANSAVIGDYDTIARTLERVIENSNLAQAQFVQRSGTVVAVKSEVGDSGSAAVTLAPPHLLIAWVHEHLPDIRQTVVGQSKDYGELLLVFDAAAVARAMWDVVLEALALSLMVLVTGVLMIRLPVNRWLGNFDRVRAHEAQILEGSISVGDLIGKDAPAEIRDSFDILSRAAGRITAQRQEAAVTLNVIADGVVTTDEHQCVLYCNPAAERMLGVSAGNAIGQRIDALLPSASMVGEAGMSRERQRLEIVRPGAETLIVDAWASDLAGGITTAVRHVMVLRDVTGQHTLDLQLHAELQLRRRALESLHEMLGSIQSIDNEAPTSSEIDLQSLIAQVANLVDERERAHRALIDQKSALDEHAIVSISDLKGDIIYANDRFCEISGYSRDELIGSNHRIVSSGQHPPEFFAELWNTISAGEVWHGQIQNRKKNGENYWVDVTIAPMLGVDGLPQQYIAIRTDITTSKHAERELARERLALANIIEGTNAGTWEWNIETGEISFNERWAAMLGYTLKELRPTTIEVWNRLIQAADLARAYVQLDRHFNGELPVFDCEFRMLHKDGHWIWVQCRGKLFSRADDGRPRWMAGIQMDITERKQAEVTLRASRAFLDKVEQIGGVGGWELDLASGAMKWTEQARRIHEAEPDFQPTIGELNERYGPEARNTLNTAREHAIATGESYDLELELTTRRGRAIWVRVIGTVEYEDGKAVRIVGVVQDITVRRQMELELRRSNELVASVIENLPCGLSVFDGDLKLVVANTEFRRLLDLPSSLLDQPSVCFEDVIRFNAARGEYGANDLEATVQAVIERVRAPIVPHQFERTRPDGMTLDIRGAPLPMGGFVTTYTDVSARKRAEAEVARGAQLLRGAIDVIDEAFVLYDPDDRLVFCNDKYREVYPESAHLMVPGTTFEDIIRPGAEMGIYAESIGRAEEWIADRMDLHRKSNMTLMQRRLDGRTLRIVERKLPDGHIVGFRIDITELVLASEAAQAATKAKSQFLANISHELRTPMNAILGMLTLLRKTELTARQADYASKTEGAARSLLSLLNEILDFSKIEAGKMTLDAQPFRIDELLRDLSVILASNVGQKRLDVLFDIDPALPRHLVGDALRLQQVLINLAGNAVKFTAEGEVVVSLRVMARDAGTVTIEFAVRDTGIGISPENQERIFSGFTQAEASTTRRFGGTGLGLAISQRLVAMMGGEIMLTSRLGEGSRFYYRITLPVHIDASAEASAERGIVPALHNAPLRALIVDDNPNAREILQRMCQSLGWQVDVADGGESALELLRSRAAAGNACQVAFVDWEMPGLDGWQTSQGIRALGSAGENLVLVMVTAHGAEMLAKRSKTEQELLDGFLVKPITASMLFDAVVSARAGFARSNPSRQPSSSSGSRLTGMRLLLVEDNLTNQQVAQELLESEGAQVQVANHGLEAVDAVTKAVTPFDVVLMDLQMPVMDGFEATRCIRGDARQQGLPIVAMTANAMASDRDECLAAGMNDHVGKPFDLDRLVAVLRKQSGWTELSEGPTAANEALLPSMVEEAATAAGVDMRTALARMGGHRKLYLDTLRAVTRDLADLPSRLKSSLAQEDVADARRLLHTLKGVAATLGASKLSAEAAQAEQQLIGVATPAERIALASRSSAAIIEARPGLTALLDALTAADQPAQAPSAAPASVVDAQALQAALHLMTSQLRMADMAATDTMEQLRLQFGSKLGNQLQALEDAVAALQFDQALQLCNELTHRLEA